MNDSTPRHPMRVVARRTGLRPATLRAWERRYGVVEPGRSDGGQRLYSDRDLERLSRLRELTELGRSISTVASLSDEEAARLLAEDRSAVQTLRVAPTLSTDGGAWVDDAFAAILDLDGARTEGVLRRASATLGTGIFLDEVAAPLLRRIGSEWAAGALAPAHEHLASGVLERVLAWLTGPSSAGAGASQIVISTLPGERHALGARLVAAAASAEGWGIVYLGADLPVSEIARTAVTVRARVVSISVVLTDRLGDTVDFLTELRSLLPASIDLLVGGRGALALDSSSLPPGIEVLNGLAGLRSALRERGPWAVTPSRNGPA